SRMAVSWRWRSGASGVVRCPVRVPRTLTGRPAAPSTAPRRDVTVVLPLVPVTPAIVSWRAGYPQRAAAARAIAAPTVPGAPPCLADTGATRHRELPQEQPPPPRPHRRLGKLVAAAHGAGDAAEEVPGPDGPAVVGHVTDRRRRRVALQLEDVDYGK